MYRVERKTCENSRSSEVYGYALTSRGADRMIKKATKDSSCGFFDFLYSKHKVRLGVNRRKRTYK